jgi:phytoene dehydrogenase-like protein
MTASGPVTGTRSLDADAVVVGAGPNGLAAALTLAREGFRVTVLEAADEPGGGTRSVPDPDLEGLVHDHCSAVHPFGVGSPFLRRLPLERHGLEWCHPPVAVAHPLGDGTAGAAHRDLDTTVAGLGEDGAAWARLYGHASAHFDALADDLLRPVIRLPRHPIVTARAGLRALLPATTIARRLRTERGRALFGGIAAHLIGPLDRPLSSSVGLVLGAAGHAYGWPFARGGSAAIWRAMVAYLEELGGEVITGTRVRSPADIPRARVVLLDLTPGGAAEVLGDRLPTARRRRYARWRHGPAAFKVDYVVRGEVPWAAEIARRAGTVHLGGSFEEIAAAESATTAGRDVERPFVLVAQPHVADPSRTRDGHVPLWTYAHVAHGSTADVVPRIDAQIERFAPGFADRVVARRVTTPAAFEAWNPNFVGGDIAGGASDGLQVVLRPRLALDPYATGVPGVYLCSSSTPPGAGVHGMCGHNAARSALKILTR